MKRKGLFFIATIIALIGINACDTGPLENAIDDFALVIGLEPINTNPSIMVYDAATDELVSEDVTVTFGGEDGDQVIDLYSFQMEEKTFNGGTLNFGLSNSLTPSEDNPASIVVTLNAPGYLESTTRLEISQEGLTSFEVDMYPLNALPDNISQTTQTSATDAEGNPIAPADMTPSQEQGKTGVFKATSAPFPAVQNSNSLLTQGGFNLQSFARNGANTIEEEDFATRFITSDEQVKTGYFSSIKVTQVSLGTDGKGLSSIPRTGTGGVSLYPGVQLIQTATSASGEQIEAFLGDDEDDNNPAEVWTYLGRDSQLQNSTTYKQFLAGNGWITQSSRADYGYVRKMDRRTRRFIEEFEMVANRTEVVTINSSDSDFTQTQEFLDVITADEDAPKLVLVNIEGDNDSYVYLAQRGQLFKYLTFALELPEKRLNFQYWKSGNNETPMERQLLGNKQNWTFGRSYADGYQKNNFPYPNIDFVFTYTAKLSWGTEVYQINPSTLSEQAKVEIRLPQKPENLTDGTVEVNLVCTNGAPGMRLNSLPATPMQFRKVDSGMRWRQATVDWEYDRAAKVLKGGTFDVSMENNSDYAFQISIDGSVYPASGPDIHTISFNNGVASINYPIDDGDFCQN